MHATATSPSQAVATPAALPHPGPAALAATVVDLPARADDARPLRRIARSSLLGSNALSIARRTLKVAHDPQGVTLTDLFFLAVHSDRLMGGGILPRPLRQGPVREGIILGIAGRSVLARVARLGTALRTEGAEGIRQAAEGAATSAVGQVMGALGTAATLLLQVSSMSRAVDYFVEHGLRGVLTTRHGRSAVLGATNGAAWLAGQLAPASGLLGPVLGVAGSLAFALTVLNGQGMLDALLGGSSAATAGTTELGLAASMHDA